MNEIPKKIFVSVLTTLTLAAIYFIGENWVFPTPDLSGKWVFVTTVEDSSYTPYIGMKLSYEVFIQQRNDQLEGTGEKFMEDLNGVEKEYVGTKRIKLRLKGRVEKKFFGKDVVRIQYEMKGLSRDTTAQHQLTLDGDIMEGRFSSTIAKEIGSVVWQRQKI